MIPTTPAEIERAIERSRKIVNRRALVAAGASALPIPGLDWIADIGVLTSLLPKINQEFGLSEEQVARLAPDRKRVVAQAISALGTAVIGRAVTRDVVLGLIRRMGTRMVAKRGARFVPLAGQALAATLTYGAIRYLCEQHIQQCAAVARQLTALPGPQAPFVERVDTASTSATGTATRPQTTRTM